MIGKYPLVRWARTCRDSSLTGRGSVCSPFSLVWGSTFLTHNFTSQETLWACALRLPSVYTGVWIPEWAPTGVLTPGEEFSLLSSIMLFSVLGEKLLWLPLLMPESTLRWSISRLTLVWLEGRAGWMMWQISIRGGCMAATAPKQVRQATLTLGSVIKREQDL